MLPYKTAFRPSTSKLGVGHRLPAMVDLPSLKSLESLVSPAKWLHRLYVDQTRIEISIPHAEGWSGETIPVNDGATGTGLLLFGLTTRSRHPVEITRVEVDYAAPLQLFDPGNRGFFVGGGTLDTNLPFCMTWEGTVIVRVDVQQAFALHARFPNRVSAQRLRIYVHARRKHTQLGGFLGQGRIHVTTKEYQVRATSDRVLGLRVPPKTGFTSPQPFLIENQVIGSGRDISVLVHERMFDGTVSSRHVRQSDA